MAIILTDLSAPMLWYAESVATRRQRTSRSDFELAMKRFSMDLLVRLAARAGLKPKLKLAA